jgi:hypothetical protein
MAAWFVGFAMTAHADFITLDEQETFGEQRWGVIPYVFSTESLGTGIGVGAFVSAISQPQASMGVTGFVTDNDSWLLAGILHNYRFDGWDRAFFDLYAQFSHFTDERFYAYNPPLNTSPRPGSNDSDKDDYISGISNDQHIELTLRYVLPLGAGKTHPLTIHRTRNGMRLSPPQGGHGWNPLTTGKTVLGARYFYRYRDLKEVNTNNLRAADTNGLQLWLDYDNTDFLVNPTFGNRQKLTLTRDFGWFDSSNSWTHIELDASWYFDLGTSDWFRQQVLALDLWTAHTPTWELNPDTGWVDNRPPPGFGSELGGYDRMRAYPLGRFHDKSAIYYAAELRLMPKVNGLDQLPILKYLEIDWWQVAGFVEAGRVAPKYDADLWFKDLKWDAGLSFRVMTFRLPVRLDWAFSDEGYSIWAMYGQPFSR